METQTARFNEKQGQLTIPDDIIATEILPRLSSIQSLLRFKSLSKSWCSFISTQNFAKTQLQKSPAKTSAIIIWKDFSDFWVNLCHVDHLFSQQDIDLVPFKFDYPNCSHSTCLVGCCNGLSCLLLWWKHFVLFNPATRKFHELPHISDEDHRITSCGFGESNGDYKVFVSSSETKSPHGLVSKLYSLKTNSWKTVEGPDVPTSLELGVVVNGKLHWTMASDHGGLEIVSFDLGNELVSAIELPSIEEMHSVGELCVLQGCICFLLTYNSDHSIVVCTMKEYGMKESWCKLLTLPDFGKEYTYGYYSPTPICISEEGEVLIHHKNLFVYNPNSNSFRRVEVDKPHSDLLTCSYSIGIFAPSLASPFPLSE